MERHANYALVGSLTVGLLVAAIGFILWLARTIHEASAPGWSEHGLSVAG